MRTRRVLVVLTVVAVSFAMFGMASASDTPATAAPTVDPFDYWTAERVASAVPRDLVIDHRGLGYLRAANGSLQPYGHSIAAEARGLHSTPVASSDERPMTLAAPGVLAAPVVDSMSPNGETIGASHTFTATIAADSSIRSVTAYVGRVGSGYQSFRMAYAGTDAGAEVWQLNLQGFSDGNWQWYIEVRDSAPRGGNRTTSSVAPFTVDTGGGGGPGVVVHDRWTQGGDVQMAAGRILFTMPDGNYVCSGTSVTDGTTGRSIILSAAHCIYDDVNKVFASNAIFIPSQDDGGGDRTDWDCSNDPIGCWAVDHGVVDINWTTRTFPDNIPWDYGYYVVSDSGAHSGSSPSPILDVAAGSLTIDFTTPAVGTDATALGYSYSADPNFMYCQETMGTNGSANYWLDSCGLTGGSSGGPWLQPLLGGNGSIISVNSWGYTTRDGMAGPKLHGNTAAALFGFATWSYLDTADRGFVYNPSSPPTSTTTTSTSSTTSTSTTTTTTLAPGGITLTVDNFKSKGEKVGALTWSGASGSTVDVVRDGAVVATTDNDGYYEDWTGLKGGGTTTWKICEAGTETCSDGITITW